MYSVAVCGAINNFDNRFRNDLINKRMLSFSANIRNNSCIEIATANFKTR